MDTSQSSHHDIEGVYTYTVNEHTIAHERWQLSLQNDSHILVRSLFAIEGRTVFGMDAQFDDAGNPHTFEGQMHEHSGIISTSLQFNDHTITGVADGQQIATALTESVYLWSESVALRTGLCRAIARSTTDETTLSICRIGVLDQQLRKLTPYLLHAQAFVVGEETVELIMADIKSTHVIFEWEHSPPQHVWFDQLQIPIQWYWVTRDAGGESAAHHYRLTRYSHAISD